MSGPRQPKPSRSPVRRARASLGLTVGFALCLSFAAPSALAQTDSEKAVATALYEKGLAAAKSGDWSEALTHLQKARKIVDSARLNYYVATALRELGRPLAAFSAYERATAKARAEGLDELYQRASTKRDEMRAQLGTITVVLDEPYEGIALQLDGHMVAPDVLDHPMPVTPGTHRLSATAPLFKEFGYPFQIRAGSEQRIVIRLLPDPEAIAKAKADESAAGRGDEGSGDRGAPGDASRTGITALGYSLVGVGVAGVAVGIGFGVDAIQTQLAIRDTLKAQKVLTDTSKLDARNTSTIIASVAGGLGLAATATGSVLLYGALSRDDPKNALHLIPAISASHYGATVIGRF